MDIREDFNHSRYIPGQKKGHYESFFQRANHPTRPLAFWIRYTVFSPENDPASAIGELWAIYFDGEKNTHVAVKREVPIRECTFDRNRFSAKVADAFLNQSELVGEVNLGKNSISWNLNFRSDAQPLFDFPESMYSTALPKAKVLVGMPLALFDGSLTVNGQKVQVKSWPGSQNHNWGSKHTDHYAWGQVSGFDHSEDTFLELATAKLKFGPIWTPALTPIVLRHRGQEFRLNQLIKTMGRATFGFFDWNFHASSAEIKIKGRITAKREDFVCLKYYNPPGGFKYCLNSKIARCDLEIISSSSSHAEMLTSKNRAAFEILTDSNDHGMSPAC